MRTEATMRRLIPAQEEAQKNVYDEMRHRSMIRALRQPMSLPSPQKTEERYPEQVEQERGYGR